MKAKTNTFLIEQLIPLTLTVATFIGLSIVLYFFIVVLNAFPTKEKILIHLRLTDVIVGMTVYLKTAIDFAIFIGNLMKSNPGWKKRIAIELGTALGNALGTISILLVWNFFREVPLLMVVMIIIASLVLLRMAEESIEEFLVQIEVKTRLHKPLTFLQGQLRFLNKTTHPILRFIIPQVSITKIKVLSFLSLGIFSFTIPFILGLDDFAGYIPLFSVVNVFGFSIGVFLGHMILNVGLFISPQKTVNLVKTKVVLLIGGIAFVGIALWGFFEAIKIALHALT